MKTACFELPDFNRMLVVSVFVHLSFMTVVLFFPKPALQPKVVVPAFQVNLIALPSSKNNRPPRGNVQARKKTVAVKPAPQPPAVKPKARRSARAKSAPPSRPAPAAVAKTVKPRVAHKSKATQALIHKLNQLDGKTHPVAAPAVNPLLQELDQLALLAPSVAKKTAVKKKQQQSNEALRELRAMKNKKALLPPPKSRKLKKPAIVEETLDELKRQSAMLKQNKIQPQKPKPPPATVSKKRLQDLEELRLRRAPEEESSAPKPSGSARKETTREKTRFAKLSGTVVRPQKTGKRSVSELLAELEALPGVVAKPEPPAKPPENKPPRVVEDPEKAFAPILKKLAALERPGKSMEIEIEKPRIEDFTSSIHKRTLPRKAQQKVDQGRPGRTVQGDRDIAAPANDKIATDLLSRYVGIIQQMIFAHWRSPLGAEYNDLVEVSFYLYPRGNIDKPRVTEKSREKKLNTLAVQAVYDSEPFPRFPADLKASNLHVTIKFKYRPADD